MIFTCEENDTEPRKYRVYQYIKDDKGLIIGSANTTQDGWFAQSYVLGVNPPWSNPEGPHAYWHAAINAAIADYIARIME